MNRLLVILITLTLTMTGANAETPSKLLTNAAICESAVHFSGLPKEIAACMDESQRDGLFILPYSWVQGEIKLEELVYFPIVYLRNDEHILCVFEKTAQGQWQLKFENPHALQIHGTDNTLHLDSIDFFNYRPDQLTQWGLLHGAIQYGYDISFSGQRYSIFITYESSSTPSGWTFSFLQVNPPKAQKSAYLNGALYDYWMMVRTGELLQYNYAINEENVGFFNVTMPTDMSVWDAASFHIDQMIDPMQYFVAAQVDTAYHGNGESLKLRSSPNGKAIRNIPNQSEIDASNLNDDWILVRYQDVFGYVDARFVKGTTAYLRKE